MPAQATLYFYAGQYASGTFTTTGGVTSPTSSSTAYIISGSGSSLTVTVGSTVYTFAGADIASDGTGTGGIIATSGGSTYYISTDPGLTRARISGIQTDTAGTNAAADLACFVTGTRIATVSGEITVETLAVGDELRLADGSARKVIWIGKRSLNTALHTNPEMVAPVHIEAGAFADNAPSRDLLLSPDHAVFVEGALIPVKHLINGHNIRQMPAGPVTYWHVELEGHHAILAEGLAVESYLENNNREEFEGNGALAIHPLFAGAAASPFAPIVTQGATLEAVRKHLAARAAAPVQDAA